MLKCSMLYASTGDIYARDNRWDHQDRLMDQWGKTIRTIRTG